MHGLAIFNKLFLLYLTRIEAEILSIVSSGVAKVPILVSAKELISFS